MRSAARTALALAAVLAAAPRAGAQGAPSRAAVPLGPAAPVAVRVSVDGAPPRTLDAAALARLPHATVTATAHEVTGRFAGVPLAAVLQAAGAWPAGSRAGGTAGERGGLRGAGLARVVVVTAADGYQAVFALAELDTATAGAPAPLLVDRVNGAALDATDGPLRVVAPGDRRPARWVRQVVAVEVRGTATR